MRESKQREMTEQEREIRETVDSQSQPYTNPNARYDRARDYRRARNEGIQRRIG